MSADNIQKFNSISDLEEFGVICLTGEACGLGMRVLCDLTQEGVDLIKEFLRVEPTSDAWNSKGIKSIMLPVSIFEEMWTFAAVRAGKRYVFNGGYVNHSQWTETKYESIDETHRHPDKTWQPEVWAVNSREEMEKIERLEGQCFYIQRWYKRSTDPGTGLDNTHAMSGRTV